MTCFLRGKKCGACGTAALGAAVTFAPDWQGTFLRCWQPREITRFAGAGRWLGRPYAKRFISRRGVAAQSVASLLAVRPPPRTIANTHGKCLLMLRAPPSGGTGGGRKRKTPQLMKSSVRGSMLMLRLIIVSRSATVVNKKVPAPGQLGRGNFFLGRAARARVSAARAAISAPGVT